MFAWIAGNTATILLCAWLLAVVALIIKKIVKDKKAGKFSCGCNCAHCATASSCDTEGGEYHTGAVKTKSTK